MWKFLRSSVLLTEERKLIHFIFFQRQNLHPHAPVILWQLARVDHTKILSKNILVPSMVSERVRDQESGFLHHKACHHWGLTGNGRNE